MLAPPGRRTKCTLLFCTGLPVRMPQRPKIIAPFPHEFHQYLFPQLAEFEHSSVVRNGAAFPFRPGPPPNQRLRTCPGVICPASCCEERGPAHQAGDDCDLDFALHFLATQDYLTPTHAP
jgi:hypothetical protein